MCGHSSGSPGGLWHFDGKEWKVVDIFNLLGEGGSYYAVHGSSEKDIWVVGGQLENFEKKFIILLLLGMTESNGKDTDWMRILNLFYIQFM